jgi:hypothetical protein
LSSRSVEWNASFVAVVSREDGGPLSLTEEARVLDFLRALGARAHLVLVGGLSPLLPRTTGSLHVRQGKAARRQRRHTADARTEAFLTEERAVVTDRMLRDPGDNANPWDASNMWKPPAGGTSTVRLVAGAHRLNAARAAQGTWP